MVSRTRSCNVMGLKKERGGLTGPETTSVEIRITICMLNRAYKIHGLP